ncbi:hypothetical protein COU78_04275 [Candidatus Peregrinibacteria bacterium CG10_big_fil_rev_8_21_14_0_10_49_24]|nr:MAG: hypothetical protein COV83_00810 [Candidatus Peregrinibacteria bacterium CG11_big_fil_rev_8_21_14_0_20_49_14]PIR50884.1 MAG: hypothetical protein COU78_04275 [Candidatus Peregrinibacteria bacterium CG10_big_fil_rev_8_21_14_0_10_49_24]PJA67161.1 MAG: hypothetical protein CO157_06205 [Candidatus Peregrinibacteria bacterium CG_4_9_14_3_um_filter_49_12]
MAKFWIRGFFALLMTAVVTGALVFVAVYGIDKQAEISRLKIETEADLCRHAWEASVPTAHVTIEMEPESDRIGSRGDAPALRRLPPPPVMAEEYPEPVIVFPREWDGSPSPWPGNIPEPPRRESPFVVEPPLPPPVFNPAKPKPYTPGSTDPARREEFLPRATRPRPSVPLNPGKVAQL